MTTTSSQHVTVAPRPGVEGYCTVRSHTEALAAPLSAEDQVVQSMDDASPTKWHRAHTTWFFEEFVLAAGHRTHRWYDEDFRYLFNSYYEAVGPRQPRPRRGMITRPSNDTVGAYRRAVDEQMLAALSDGDLSPDALELVELGLHHEQQHQELVLMDALHLLSCNPLRPTYDPHADADPAAVPASSGDAVGWLGHDGGVVEIGHCPGNGFAFDNEGPRHRVLLEAFEVADRPVSCGEWLGFVADGGYERPELWLSDGWAKACSGEIAAPLYWEHHGGDRNDPTNWAVFGLRGLAALDPAAPVSHVSYHEADAFARWSGARLPTEAEWEVAAATHGGHLDPHGFFGRVWQWTSSAYLAYPGFAPAPGAVGEYNGKFMVSQHVLRGSSAATPAGHQRATYRNFFPPCARWAFSGVRLARG